MSNTIMKILTLTGPTVGILLASTQAGVSAIESEYAPHAKAGVSPMKICGYPDNPNRSCEWYESADTCFHIFETDAPAWQKMACAAAGFSKK